MRKVEKFLWALFAVNFILHLVLGETAVLILVSGLLLILFYLFFSVFLLRDIKVRHMFRKQAYANVSAADIMHSVVLGLLYATFSLGVLIKVLHWYAGFILLLFSAVLLLMATPFRLFSARKTKWDFRTYSSGIRIRNLIFIVLSVVFMAATFLPVLKDGRGYIEHKRFIEW